MGNKRKVYSAEFKTKVVLECLRDTQTVSEISAKYNVTPKNIHNWKVAFLSNAELAMDPSRSVAKYKKDNEELQSQLDDYAKNILNQYL